MPGRIAKFVAGTLLAAVLSSTSLAATPGVKIGVLTDLGGIYSDLGGPGSVVAAQMAVHDFGGSVLGQPIEVISADHQENPDTGSAIARRWIDNENVDVIVDVPVSSVAIAVQSVTKDRSKIFLNTGGSSGELSGKACSPYAFQWTKDTYGLAVGTARALVKEGGDTWFFLTADYTFGHALEHDAAAAVQAAGGKVLGEVEHPFNTNDFSSYLLQAQASGARVIGMANGGGDAVRSIQQAREFGITTGNRLLAGLSLEITDVHGIGLPVAQGTYVTDSFYWDMNDSTRAWSKRFMALHGGAAPTSIQAAVYGSITHYLQAVQAAGTKDTATVAAKMRATPINDFYTKGAYIRQDGRVVRDFYLFRVKTPAQSHADWDFFNVVATIPAETAVRPLADSECPLIAKH
jgi:branched-chain amino acid transport system substrate-binding protein